MAGTRLGVICQSLAIMFFGIAFGCYINWQVTLIVLVPLIIMDDFHGDIKFVGVKFISPTRPTSVVLNKFQLNIMPKGQRVALVGGSGCGKSTTIQLLQRFYGVKKGQILLDGVDIRALNIHWVHSQFGLVSQEPILFDLTIADNIAYDLEDVSMTDIIDAAKKVSIHQFIEQLPDGYETKVGIKDSFLSGGEKQRVTIARVLIRRSKVLLLDEATSAMDSQNEQVQGGAKVGIPKKIEYLH
ncbi:unnamed protein product [Rotaria magnacalcarata]|uniref:ABC transporter domain-containing protein n=1 Tax=Rotaria magnacalcarata TaxID=392030 RepID=A0A816CBG1_9BILA|nr:unnamed protein product [Rotaria magnacalcarata]